MSDIFSAPLQTKGLPACVVYWNNERDWILVDEAGEEFASLYRKALVERMQETTAARNGIGDVSAMERRVYNLMAKPGKRTAHCPAIVAEYFSMP